MTVQVHRILSPASKYIKFKETSDIDFKLSDIKKIYHSLGLTFPDHNDAFQGSLIPYYGDIGTSINDLFVL
jgi:hypothetical protein